MDKSKIKKSLEYRYYHRHAVTCIVFLSLFIVAQLLVMIIPKILDAYNILDMDNIDFKLSFVFLIVILTPFTIYYLYKSIYMLKNYNEYTFIEVLLKEYHTKEFNNSKMYFEVEIQLEDLKIRKFTPSIFYTSTLFGLFLDDYLNKKVLVGYRVDKDYVMIIEEVK